LSQDPVDQLIRELIRTRRAATSAEVGQIIRRVASAPFNRLPVTVPVKQRGLSYLGRTLGSSEDAFFVHLVKRVLVDREWALGVTEQQYAEDLRWAVRHQSVQLAVYERRGGPMVLAMAPNGLPPTRLGLRVKPWISVVYSADRGMIVSGYQSAGIPAGVPSDSTWLKR
jgi:hypothetical protein